jgi:hypothetical protein
MNKQLNALAAALACGTLWGISLLVWTWLAIQWQVGASTLELLTDIYPRYEVTPLGSLLGLVWGFVDGFVGAYILVKLYNFFARHLN